MSEARKLKKRAKRDLEEFRLALRRARKAKSLSPEFLETAEEICHRVKKSLKDGDLEALAQGVNELEDFQDQHLSRYRPSAVWETVKALFIAVLIAVFIRWMFIEPFRIPSGSMIPTLLVGDQLMVNRMAFGPDILVPYFISPNPGEEELQELKVKSAPRWSFRVDDKEIILAWKKLWIRRPPRRGEVVVFRYPENPKEDYIKRVIGVPGDKVEMREGRLFLNDQEVKEVYVGPYKGPAGDGRCYQYDLFDEELPTGDGILVHPVLHCRPRIRDYRYWDFGPVVVPEGMFFAMGDNRDNSADSRSWGFVPFSYLKGTAMFIHLPLNPERGYLPRWDRFFKPVR